MLKNLALMGVGTEGSGKVVVTDMDRIERSNLSRQFLFRNSDIGKSKSETAVKAIKRMNPAMQCEHFEVKVCPESEDIFSDSFFEELSFVCNALDNVEARRYVDSRCVRFDKPLLESGTLGTKGNTQIIVPFLTESYGATSDPQGCVVVVKSCIEEKIPICTLKNYPYKIEHTIQWSRDLFEGLFTQAIQTLIAYKNNPDYLDTIVDRNQYDDAVRQLHQLLVETPCHDFDDCIRWARRLFHQIFDTEIRNITYQFPVCFFSSSHRSLTSSTRTGTNSGPEINSSLIQLSLILITTTVLHLSSLQPYCVHIPSISQFSTIASTSWKLLRLLRSHPFRIIHRRYRHPKR